MRRWAWLFVIGFASVHSALLAQDEDAIGFTRDIRPILSDACFACHGPDEKHREGGFRLDSKESALGEADSGSRPIVSGDLDASELFQRITSDDPSLRMPPADSNKTINPEDIEKIRQWILQGATWREHWAFVTPTRPDLPAVKKADWPRNEIDRFILARLEKERLQPSSPADKITLIRRVTFDLTGLPPTPDEIDAFLADDSPEAYERLVDRLLRSPRYGEHMARFWLDVARYGDTHGLHLDNYREMWPYRDWVIRAFNENKPFDQFTVEQLAGDLLSDATLDQIVATGFNRCHVTTNEGGSIVEEVYVRNVVDRVVTTGTVFMGMTFECTRCHDHKYDPFTMRDFYSMFAYFNSIDGSEMDGNKKDPAPVTTVLTDQQQEQLASLRAHVERLKQTVASNVASFEYVEPESPSEPQPEEPKEFVWIDDAVPSGAKAEGGWQFVEGPTPIPSGAKVSTRTAEGLSQHYFTGAAEPLRVGEGDTLFTYVYLDPKNPPKEIMLQWNDGKWEHRAYWGGNHIDWGAEGSASRKRIGDLPNTGEWQRLEVAVADVGLSPGAVVNGWAFTQFDGTTYWDKAGIVSRSSQTPVYDSLALWLRDQQAAKGASLPEPLKSAILADEDKRTAEQNQQLRDHFIENVYVNSRSVFDPLHQQIDEVSKEIKQIEDSAATTLVFREAKTRKPSYILERGEYDRHLDEVQRATPAILPPLPEGLPNDRLGLAKWLVDPSHPLTSRVTVNRLWQQVFGIGLVKTSEDFGSQGEPPSHPELLDWLAVQFIEDGWNVKAVMKRFVMSATYQQSSRVDRKLLERDPRNRLLARGPRFRLDAEMLRDQALAVSGLLVTEMGGPSVKPPQPDTWFTVGYSGSNTVRFQKDEGANKVYRRTVYTFIKRTAPPPQMSTFDAPSREACVARRERTNTPLQALLLLNDPQYFEAARAFAERTIRDGGNSPESRLDFMFRLATGRHPDADERSELASVLADQRAIFEADPEAAKQAIQVGESAPTETMEPVELAAWTMVANLVLNLDEVLTKN